jgi:putative restriction endonuclease
MGSPVGFLDTEDIPKIYTSQEDPLGRGLNGRYLALMALDQDWQIRLAAFDALRRISETGVVTRDQMDAGFEFEGQRIPFALKARGIWRPATMKSPGAALSVTTASIRKGVKPKYDDQIGGEGWFEYRYQGNDPTDWDNVAVRRAYELKRPLVYFYGVGPKLYEAIYPAYVVGDSPGDLTFRLAADAPGLGIASITEGGGPEPLKEYATRQVKVRLHQHRFRELVLGAYGHRCTICRIAHVPLLDAAHILPDRDQRGLPEVPNGLSLCKIHHTAYDVNILGITPGFQVEIRKDILKERDGPMLKHGLQELDGARLGLPRSHADRPNPAYLEERHSAFRAA